MTSVQIIILNWNGGDYIEQCLAALAQLAPPRPQILVVDNGSTDGSVDRIRELFPDVALLENGRNLGFAAGNNVALRRLEADVAILLNPDVVVSPDWLGHLVQALEADPAIGIAGGKLLYPDGRTIQYAGGVLTPPQAMPGHHGVGELDSGQHDRPRDVDYVIGGAMALRRELLEQVGLFDEGYFLYFEDADLSSRARTAGWRCVYVPEATAVHVESAATVKGSSTYHERFHSGRWRYLLKHFPVDFVLAETVPAERDWLARIDPEERRAAALAYTTTLSQLYPGQTTLAASESEMTESEKWAHLRQTLLGLRQLAWQAPPHTGPDSLRQLADIREPEFESDVPVVGPLIARFRTAWRDVAVRWYVRPLLDQQGRFNQQLIDELEQAESQLGAKLTIIQEMEAALVAQRTERQQLLLSVTELEEAVEKAAESLKAGSQE